MRKVIFTLATGLFLVAGVANTNACGEHGKKATKASTEAAVTGQKKEFTIAQKKECATGKTASAQKSCCMSKSKSVEAQKETPKKIGKSQAKL